MEMWLHHGNGLVLLYDVGINDECLKLILLTSGSCVPLIHKTAKDAIVDLLTFGFLTNLAHIKLFYVFDLLFDLSVNSPIFDKNSSNALIQT